MQEQQQVAIIAADLTREGLIVHFSDGTSGLFASSFLYAARKSEGNMLLVEQGKVVTDSPFSGALNED